MADLKTNYVDDVLDTTKNQLRKYQQIQNDDKTVSFVDVTEYTQVGTSFGAKDINDTNAAINDVNGKLADLIITRDYSKPIYVPSYSYKNDSIDVRLEGYAPIGIIGINTGTFVLAIGTNKVDGNTATIQFICSTSDGFNGNYIVTILYIKTS